jgi:predicted metal-binding membrane protein
MSATAAPLHKLHGSGNRTWVLFAALLFCVATTLTIVLCASMSSKGGMPMPGGWTMSMAWARMCGQTWSGAAAAFAGMWTAMTVAMMLPVLLPVLWRWQTLLEEAHRSRFVVLMGAGYFAVWIAAGMAFYPLGAGMAALLVQLPPLARAAPLASGLIVALAGGFQLSSVKARYLACCRAMPRCQEASPLRHGMRLGVHCCGCCAGLTAMLLAVGVMNGWAMVFTATAIAAERFARDGNQVARIVGGLLLVIGGALIVRALWALA